MIFNRAERFCSKRDETIAQAYWQFSMENKITIVVDEEGKKFLGVVGHKEYEYAKKHLSAEDKIETLVNRNCSRINCADDIDVYMQARNLFAEHNFKYIPVINKNNEIVDLFSRERAFYKQYFMEGKLERMHYALCIWTAAREAKKLGKKAISIIEFGVAGGHGLLAAQMHAEEIGRIFDISIQVYGFDSGGSGLPDSADGISDSRHIFTPGLFKMNFEKLRSRLFDNTHLVLGNIEETLKTFTSNYEVPPVGAIFVDVDYYTSTKPIMGWLAETGDEFFLPRIFMYFDDVSALYEGVGEHKAIQEFNEANHGRLKISPETVSGNIDWFFIVNNIRRNWLYSGYEYGKERLKICHRFHHEDYLKEIVDKECDMWADL